MTESLDREDRYARRRQHRPEPRSIVLRPSDGSAGPLPGGYGSSQGAEGGRCDGIEDLLGRRLPGSGLPTPRKTPRGPAARTAAGAPTPRLSTDGRRSPGNPDVSQRAGAAEATVTERNSKLASSSLYRDLLGGRPTEVEQILGDLVARARALSVQTPRWTRRRCNCGCNCGRLSGRGRRSGVAPPPPFSCSGAQAAAWSCMSAARAPGRFVPPSPGSYGPRPAARR
ncbi:ketopantoate reductase C-terminal domain-containing protein [Streptomyces sp. NPDC001978]|uniref:ketopantoate reductase C-terminal domain-containing protein n=1 Tax=Streptomyces sp. NPDC001978 TaxID=3364627 RepID=UPI003696ADA7